MSKKFPLTIVIPAGSRSSIGADVRKYPGIKVLVERGISPSKNRNMGAKKAKTPFVAFINAHTLLSENWLDEVLKFFKKYPEIDIVGGPQLTHGKEGEFAKASGYALASFGGGLAVRRYKQHKRIDLNADEFSLTTANLICRKEVFSKVKFDEKVYPGEDPKFINDAKYAGFKVAYSPDIVTYNLRRASFSALSKQIFRYGKSRMLVDKKISLKNVFFSLPSIFLVYLISLPVISVFTPLAIYPLVAYIALDLFFSVIGGIKEKSFPIMMLLPFIFPTIHISYAIGFIEGIFEHG